MEQTNKFFRKINIAGSDYHITVLPALPALSMAKKLAAVILPAFGGLADGLRESEYGSAPSTFSDLALTLCNQLDGIDEVEIVATLLDNVTCNNMKIDINEHFRGNLGGLITLLEFALKENFSSFFTGKFSLAHLKTFTNKMQTSDETLDE